MIYSRLYENASRGTPDFPVEYYLLTPTHPRYLMQAHWHKDYEIIRVKSGALYMKLNNLALCLNPGESVLLPGGIIHSAIPDACEYECLVLSPSVMFATGRCRSLLKAGFTKPLLSKDNALVRDLFHTFTEKRPGYEIRTVGLLYLLFSSSPEQPVLSGVADEYKIEKIKLAITYIEENFDTDIRLADLADCCSMSSNYFCKFFKEVTSQTPIEYLTTYRIECACDMLLSGKSVTDTALGSGFNDLSYFIHVFKKHTGLSPKQYRLRSRT